ncbi:MAG: glycogen synthase [Elusimicrobia bacterium]|nr:glycogen synthase [Candidatus Liberimonas magnetica]
MKIGILTNEYPPYVYGGAGVHVEYLTNELVKLDGGKHSVKVFCFGDQRLNKKNLSVKGVNAGYNFHTKDPRHVKFLDTIQKDIVMSGELEGIDIVHCHTWYTHFAGLLTKQLMQIPLVLTTHSLEPRRPWKAEQLGSAYQASSWIEKTAYKNADGVIAISESMKEDAHNLYGVELNKIRLIHNGIDTNEFRPVLDKEILGEYGIDKKLPYILFVGRITRQKGIIHLVNAIKHIKPVCQIVLCAGAPDTKEIGLEMKLNIEKAKRVSKNRIIWISEMLPRKDLIAVYSGASVFICPSVYEPFGIINLEAMACKIPVVATKVGGIPEVVVHGKTGILVPITQKSSTEVEPRDKEKFAYDIAKAVNSLLASPKNLKEMGLKARRRVIEHFSWASIAEKTIDFYKDVIKDSV